jgi:hypothetical protein
MNLKYMRYTTEYLRLKVIKNSFVFSVLASVLLMSGCWDQSEKVPQANLVQSFRLSDGLEMSLIPPDNFTITAEHFGFTQAESFTRIKISEIETPYASYISVLTKENLLKNKLELLNSEQIKIKGAWCTLLTLRENIAGTYFEKRWLISGDKLSSIKIEASYPEGAGQGFKQKIKESLLTLSVKTDDDKRIYTGLPFNLTETTNFKVKKRFANSIVLESIDDTKKSNVVVISHGKTKTIIDDRQQLANHFLKNNKNYEDVEIIKNNEIKQAGIPALATTAYAENNDQTYWIYQVLVYQKERFLLVQGQSLKEDKRQFSESVNELLTHLKFK